MSKPEYGMTAAILPATPPSSKAHELAHILIDSVLGISVRVQVQDVCLLVLNCLHAI